MQSEVDSFQRTAASVLRHSHSEYKLEKLIRLRRQHQARLAALGEELQNGNVKMPSAIELNAWNNEFFRAATELLGPVDFQEIFGIPAGAAVNFVEQDALDAQRITAE